MKWKLAGKLWTWDVWYSVRLHNLTKKGTPCSLSCVQSGPSYMYIRKEMYTWAEYNMQKRQPSGLKVRGWGRTKCSQGRGIWRGWKVHGFSSANSVLGFLGWAVDECIKYIRNWRCKIWREASSASIPDANSDCIAVHCVIQTLGLVNFCQVMSLFARFFF